MKVDPNKVSFPKRMRGYQVRRVDSYIESLCSDFTQAEEDYQARIIALEKEISRLRTDLEGYRSVEVENVALREELERLKASRQHLLRRAKAALQAKAKKRKRPVRTPLERQVRTQAFFSKSADIVRLVGHTSQKVSHFVDILPTPKCATKPITPAPANAKQAKELAKKLSKQEKQINSAQKKIKKAQKVEKAQTEKLQKLNLA